MFVHVFECYKSVECVCIRVFEYVCVYKSV